MPSPRRVDTSQSVLSFYGPASKRPKAVGASASASASSPPSRRNTNLTIILPDRPPPSLYFSCSSGSLPQPPAPWPISLVPPRCDAAGVDTGAFIVDKVVTPLDGSWGEVPATADDYDTDEEDARYAANPQRQTVRRMLCYVVGWPDEPYARQLVRCTDILDYVSPRVLEDWEYARMEEQRRRREQQAQARAQARAVVTTAAAGGVVKTGGDRDDRDDRDDREEKAAVKKGPGRPVKTAAATAARVAKAAAKAAAREAAAREEAGKTAPPPTISTIPTLSTTPSKKTKKTKLPPLVDGRLPRPGSSMSRRPSLSSGLQIQLDSPSRASQVSVSLSARPPPAALAALPTVLSSPVSLKRPFQKLIEEQQEGVDIGMATTTTTTATTTADTCANEDEDEEGDEEEEEEEEDDDDDDDDDDELHSYSFHSLYPPTPLPSLRKTPPVAHRRQTSRSQPPPPPKPDNKSPSLVEPNMPPLPDPSLLKRKRSQVETPIRPPDLPLSQHLHPSPPSPSLPVPNPQQLHDAQAKEAKEVEAGEAGEEDNLYEVDRIEADCLAAVDADGSGDMEGLPADAEPELVPDTTSSRLLRYFLVRWKGDWPPDQNPTWEPAENLPPRMVRQYLKKAAQKRVSRA
ncbi:MAG: hypothetical protein STHCBS139747_008000 [Sporothrix thermara]